MKRLLLTLATLLGLVTPAAAVPTPPADRQDGAGNAAAIAVLEKKRDGRVRSFTVSTPSLEMSSTTPLKVHVVLPEGYRQHRKRRYPVLYAFPGTSNKASVWLTNIPTVELTQKRKVIVVIADGTYNADGGGFYTDWVDQSTSRGVANWETFHTQELVSWVDRRYRTVRSRAGRAVVGISQGGFGSMSYAARHPDLYGAAASFSGAVDIWHGAQCRLGATTLIAGIMTGLNGVQPFAPFGDPVTNAANWEAHDPGSLVENLANTRVDLYTSTGLPGESDLADPAVPGTAGMEALLHQSNLCFKDAADAAGVPYHWHSYLVGTHAWGYAERSLADYLPRLMRFFRAGR
jgi:S-formylglutathione hydrolase FrmB